MKFQTVPSSKHKSRNKPEAVSSLLESTFKTYRIANKMKQYSVFQDWPQIVGEEFARIAEPERITRGGVLILRVLEATWAQEITLRKADLLNKLQNLPNGPVVHDIRFVVSGPRDLGIRSRKAGNDHR